jgi:23S rRNA pseudouridine2604 synthase
MVFTFEEVVNMAVNMASMIAEPRPRRQVLQKGPAKDSKTAPGAAAPDSQRLSKVVMVLKGCSRAEAEQFIEGGWVSVNGQVVEEPMVRVSNQTVDIDPQASLLELASITLLLHKPPGFDALARPGEANPRVKPAQALLKPETHAADDASETRVLKRHFAKLTACVPLETAASGLVVFTQDWRVVRKLEEDLRLIEQEIIVEVAGVVEPAVLKRLNHGLASDGDSLPPVKVSLNSTGDATSKLRFAVKGSHPGLIAYLCERVGLEIKSMKRLRIGKVGMGRVGMGQLPTGQWRYLQGHERF